MGPRWKTTYKYDLDHATLSLKPISGETLRAVKLLMLIEDYEWSTYTHMRSKIGGRFTQGSLSVEKGRETLTLAAEGATSSYYVYYKISRKLYDNYDEYTSECTFKRHGGPVALH